MARVPSEDYVKMEKHVCKVCNKLFDSGNILLHKNMRAISEDKTITGFGLCPEHQKLFDEGYVALIVIDESKSRMNGNDVKPKDAHRTGMIIHLRREVMKEMFDMDLSTVKEMIFIDQELATLLEKKKEEADASENSS